MCNNETFQKLNTQDKTKHLNRLQWDGLLEYLMQYLE